MVALSKIIVKIQSIGKTKMEKPGYFSIRQIREASRADAFYFGHTSCKTRVLSFDQHDIKELTELIELESEFQSF